jgi:hypothetical protein
MKARAKFDLDKFDQSEPYLEDQGVNYARAAIDKTYLGDIEAKATIEMLSTRGPSGGAGYVALERVEGSVGGKWGSFALLHIGTMTEESRWARWPIVPGSGTGELEGITGEGTIDIVDGQHFFDLEYEIL